MSGTPDDEYFSDGISEEIIMRLIWQGIANKATNMATVVPQYPFLGLAKDHPERARLRAALGW